MSEAGGTTVQAANAAVQSARPRRLVVLGAATSAGTHHAGQERAPEALRAAGFVRHLKAAGLAVTDLGDIVRETFRVDRSGAPARNEAAVVRTAGAVADAVERIAAGRTAGGRTAGEDPVLVVLGGDCTITLGVLAGLQRAEPDTGLVYFDGDADLSTPGHGSGIMDATGMAHLLGLAETGLTGLFARRPPIAASRLAVLGYDESDPGSFTAGIFGARAGLTHFPDRAVRADPAGCARAAREAVAAARRLVVHFDVDAVDSGDLPLANFPHYGTGVPLSAARRVLSVLFAAPRLSAVVLTEVNPGYDPDGDSLARYTEAVAGALAAGLTGT
jgi:arginase